MTTLERQLTEENGRLRTEISNLGTENKSLRARIDWLLRRLHGRSSEKVDTKQLLLELAELAEQLDRAKAESAEAAPAPRPAPRRAGGHGRRGLPETMEEKVVFVDPDEVRAEPESYRQIGSESSERLDIVPPRLVRIVTVRRKYVRIGAPEAAPVIAALPPSAVEKGLPTARLLAWVVVSRFCDHNPLYRREKAFARLGFAVSRKTMCDWMRSVE